MKKKFRELSGVFLLDKAEGLSSNRALQDARFLFEAKKAGHTGTLDPFATGLLLVCFGEANKFSRWFLGADKTYEFTIKLGIQTTTADKEGDIICKLDIPDFTDADLLAVQNQFLGEIEQIPPQFSALRINGKRAYELARKGEEVVLKPRQVVIHYLQLYKSAPDEIRGVARVSKGTYIRVLTEDIAKSLQTVGHCLQLRRSNIADLPEVGADMHTYQDIKSFSKEELDKFLMPIDTLCSQFERYDIDQKTWQALAVGKKVTDFGPDASQLRTYLGEQFVGLTSRKENLLTAFRLINTNK